MEWTEGRPSVLFQKKIQKGCKNHEEQDEKIVRILLRVGLGQQIVPALLSRPDSLKLNPLNDTTSYVHNPPHW